MKKYFIYLDKSIITRSFVAYIKKKYERTKGKKEKFYQNESKLNENPLKKANKVQNMAEHYKKAHSK